MESRLYVGVDLHKTQFTTCTLMDDQVIESGTQYPTDREGYNAFIESTQLLADTYNRAVSLAIESTANARYFRDVMERNGFEVTVVNTLRFKVINLSTKKTDKNDAKTLAEFLSRDILPESHLCSAESEGLRSMLRDKSRQVS